MVIFFSYIKIKKIMKSTLFIQGLWFLPENKSHKVPGTLNYHPDKEAYLELIGSFDNDKHMLSLNSSKEIEFILGISTESEEISLYKSFRISRVATQKRGMKLVQ